MSEREATIRMVVVTYFPMFIATLSLVTSIYNGYLNNKFVDIIQRNFGRAEYLKTCKEIIDAYFQVKFRAGIVSEAAEREGGTAGASTAQTDAANAVNKFAALGTYLANLRDERTREQYSHLSQELEKVVRDARKAPPGNLNKLFEPADRLFAAMNDDCVRTAKQ
jgi:5'-deoxynucleotidase YfbR-like HD superfamily hydrolase